MIDNLSSVSKLCHIPHITWIAYKFSLFLNPLCHFTKSMIGVTSFFWATEPFFFFFFFFFLSRLNSSERDYVIAMWSLCTWYWEEILKRGNRNNSLYYSYTKWAHDRSLGYYSPLTSALVSPNMRDFASQGFWHFSRRHFYSFVPKLVEDNWGNTGGVLVS